MTRNIAVIIDGVWQWQEPPQVVNDHAISARNNSNVVNLSEVDQIVSLLTQVVVKAQGLSDGDQRRVRDFVRAALSMLEATTSLPKSDQRIFEAALRDVAARKYG
jgi:hypothetical protein